MFPTKLEGNCKQPRLSSPSLPPSLPPTRISHSRSSPFNPTLVRPVSPHFSPFLPAVTSCTLSLPRWQPVRAERHDNPSFDSLGRLETRYQTVMKSLSSTRFLLEPVYPCTDPMHNALARTYARELSVGCVWQINRPFPNEQRRPRCLFDYRLNRRLSSQPDVEERRLCARCCDGLATTLKVSTHVETCGDACRFHDACCNVCSSVSANWL